MNIIKFIKNLHNYKFIMFILLNLPTIAYARGGGGQIGALAVLAGAAGIMYLIALITIGGPIMLINKLRGHNDLMHQDGGIIFNLSLILGPILGVTFMSILDTRSWEPFVFGYISSIFVFNHVIKKD